MAKAIGIDLGGTKIEVQVFADDWTIQDRRRVETPADYSGLLDAMSDQIDWAETIAGAAAPVGIGAAGLIHPTTGLALTANLPASGKPFPADLEARAGRPLTYINDCQAFTISESVFGVAKGYRNVVGLVIGTGVGGGVVIDRALLNGPARIAGEFGHLPAPAHLLKTHNLPVFPCGCGKQGCVESYLSGPGLSRMAEALTGQAISAAELVQRAQDEPPLARVWSIWQDLAGDLLRSIALVADPEVVVLGGGLSKIEGIAALLKSAQGRAGWTGYPTPEILVAGGGDASGARGAAYVAWQAAQ